MLKTPVNGMKDILPKEMEIRQYLLKKIREVYIRFGFTEIQTPHIEHIENLLGSKGWDNEKLIFKILKRGEKLEEAKKSSDFNDIIDSGLRYDLTVPLSRYFSNNKKNLVFPFRALQVGSVFRADRPQKFRFREFTQCDIDIIGDKNYYSEIDLLVATGSLLNDIDFLKYNPKIEINDRRLLKSIQKYCGFDEKYFDDICIVLDKIDKIGLEKVIEELKNIINDNSAIEKFRNLILKIDNSTKKLETLKNELNDDNINSIIDNLIYIINIVNKENLVNVEFNITLVRGMGYYTGTIFEIKLESISSSIGGGGRYDNMISNFSNEDIPAVGISLGFERLITILIDNNFSVDNMKKKFAMLIDYNDDINVIEEKYKRALEKRKNGDIVYIATKAKNVRFQKEVLSNNNYEFLD